jgi:glycosyltransferase involved in cell wall biosynthesis
MVNAIMKDKANPRIQVIAAPSDNTSQNESSSDIQIDSIKITKSQNLILRALKEFLLSVKIALAIDSNSSFQVYTIPSPIILLATYFRKNKNFGIDVRDCSWDYIDQKGFLGSLAAKILKFILRPIFKRASFISCTNHFESSSILRNFNRDAIIIPNGIEESKYKKLIEISDKNFDNKSPTKILYAGNIGYAQSLMTLVKTSKDLNSFHFELVGEGSQKNQIKEHIRVNGISNVILTPAIQWSKLSGKYVEADILYAQITSDYASAIPTKIFEYLATGRKVVLGLPDGPAKSIFSAFSGVFIHQPNDVEDCKSALNTAKKSSQPDRIYNNVLLREYVRENFNGIFTEMIGKSS